MADFAKGIIIFLNCAKGLKSKNVHNYEFTALDTLVDIPFDNASI